MEDKESAACVWQKYGEGWRAANECTRASKAADEQAGQAA